MIPFGLFVLAGIALAVWFFWPVSLDGKGGCMIWSGDQYKQVSCGYKSDDLAQAIGLDTAIFLHFKKITDSDTLTAASLGKVWYIKIDGGTEFYTAPGLHPLHRDRRLLPLTAIILKNHNHHN